MHLDRNRYVRTFFEKERNQPEPVTEREKFRQVTTTDERDIAQCLHIYQKEKETNSAQVILFEFCIYNFSRTLNTVSFDYTRLCANIGVLVLARELS